MKNGAVLLVECLCIAASPTSAANEGQQLLVFTHVVIIDGKGGAPVEGGTLIVRGSRIEAVGSMEDVAIPPGAEVIDLSDEGDAMRQRSRAARQVFDSLRRIAVQPAVLRGGGRRRRTSHGLSRHESGQRKLPRNPGPVPGRWNSAGPPAQRDFRPQRQRRHSTRRFGPTRQSRSGRDRRLCLGPAGRQSEEGLPADRGHRARRRDDAAADGPGLGHSARRHSGAEISVIRRPAVGPRRFP